MTRNRIEVFFVGATGTVLRRVRKRSIMSNRFPIAKRTLVTGIAALIGIPAGSWASALPVAQYTGTVQVSASTKYGSQNSPRLSANGPGAYSESLAGYYGDSASAQVTISTTPLPTVWSSATASSPDNWYYSPSASAAVTATQLLPFGPYPTLQYSFEILGPAGHVDILASATVRATSSALPAGGTNGELSFASLHVGPSGGGASFQDTVYIDNYGPTRSTAYTYVRPPSGGETFTNLAYNPITGFSGEITQEDIWAAQTNVIYSVTLTAYDVISVYGGWGGGTITATTFVDPTFQLAPTVPNPGLYTLAFSDGIGNGLPAVPEPETYAMLLVGLGLLGFVAQRRKQKAA